MGCLKSTWRELRKNIFILDLYCLFVNYNLDQYFNRYFITNLFPNKIDSYSPSTASIAITECKARMTSVVLYKFKLKCPQLNFEYRISCPNFWHVFLKPKHHFFQGIMDPMLTLLFNLHQINDTVYFSVSFLSAKFHKWALHTHTHRIQNRKIEFFVGTNACFCILKTTIFLYSLMKVHESKLLGTRNVQHIKCIGTY